MTLQSYTGYLSEEVHANTRNKLLVPIVRRGRINKGNGIRFCPRCLEESIEPYFKKQWRLSFVTTCSKHQCFLQNCCPKCHFPVTPYKVKDDQGFCRCHNCDLSLFENNSVTPIPQDSYGAQAQINLLNILHSGIFEFEKESYISLAFFPVLKQIAKLVYNFNLRDTILEHESLASSIKLPDFKEKPSVYVEDIQIQEQYIVYSASEHLLKDLNHVHLFCKANHIGKGILTHSMGYIPFWFTFIIWENNLSSYSISAREAENAIIYLRRNKIPVSFSSLSRLIGSRVEARKRKDIYNLVK